MREQVAGKISPARSTSAADSGNGPSGRWRLFKENGQVVAIIVSITIAVIFISGQIGKVENRLADRIGRLESRIERIEDDLADTREQLSYIRGIIGRGDPLP